MIVFPPGKTPDLFNVFHLGFGPDCFIANSGWFPAYTGTNLFRLKKLCSSRDAAKAEQMRENMRLPKLACGTDYKYLMRAAFDSDGDCDVACITTETPGHAEQMVNTMEIGCPDILVDKPMVTSLAELEQVKTAQKASGCQIGLTYNHTFNAPTHQMRHLAQEVGIESIQTFFLQSWLSKKETFRQFVWRTADERCGLLDIWSHAENLASFLTGEPIKSVSNVKLGTEGEHGCNIFDNGKCTATFDSDLTGEIRFHQALKGHQDDIGALIKLKDGRNLMWRLELGVDNLWTSKYHSASPFGNLRQWERSMRGDGSFAEEVDAIFDETPPGHHQGWSSMWRYLFTAYAGSMYKKRNIDLGFGDELPPIFNVKVPGLIEAEQTARFIEATIQAHEGGNTEVKLADMAA